MRHLFRTFRIRGVLAAIIGLYTLSPMLARCGQPVQPLAPVPFEEFCGISLDRFTTLDEKGLRQWIRDHSFDIPIRKLDNRSGTVIYYWSLGEAVLLDGHLAALRVLIGTEAGKDAYGQVVNRFGTPVAGKEITLGQVVDKLGPPEAISTSTSRASDDTGHEILRYWISLNYSGQGLLIGASIEVQPDMTAVELSEDIRVRGILCFTPGSTETLKRLNRRYNLEEYGPWIAWPGFGALMPLDKH